MSNVLYLLPSLSNGFATRLEAIEQITKSGLVVFPNGDTWAKSSLWVEGANGPIIDRPCRGAYKLAQHIEWLKSHVATSARLKQNEQPQRKVFTPINLPSKEFDKQERLDVINKLITYNEHSDKDSIKFKEGLVSFDGCRVLGDQIVTEWENGSGFRIETELAYLLKGIVWEKERANRPAFSAKPAPRSIHPNRRLSDEEKAAAKRKQAERNARVRAASMEDLAIRARLPRPGAQAGNSKGKKGRRAA